jgi:hypothetical protein
MSDINSFVGTTISQSLSFAFKQYPTVLKAAAIPTILFMGLLFYYLLPGMFDSLTSLALLEDSEDPAAIFSAIGNLMGPILLMTIIGVFYYGVVFAPLLRNILYDEAVGLLRMDSTVLRLAGAMTIIYFIMIAVAFAAMIPIGIVAGIAEASGNSALAGFASLLMVLVLYGAIFYIMVRTSLIVPDVAASGRLRISNGWKTSKGNFWGLFVTYLVVYIIAMLVTYAGMILAIIVGGVGVATNDAFTNLDSETFDVTQMGELISAFSMSPLGIIAFIIYGLATIFSMGAFCAMMGFAYKNLAETAENEDISDI